MPSSTRGDATKQIAKPNYKLDDIKLAMRGRAVDVLRDVAGIPAERLDGKNHSCPDCGGEDRFRLIDVDRGAVFCNQCFNKKSGDAIAAVRHYKNMTLPESLAMIAEYLGFDASTKSTRRARTVKKGRTGKRATRSTRAISKVSKVDIKTEAATVETNRDLQGIKSTTIDQSDLRYQVYTVILSALTLTDKHRTELRQRGLTEEAIDEAGYRSVVSLPRNSASSLNLRKWTNDDRDRKTALALTVPGVGKLLEFLSPLGLLIPVRDTFGRIVALKNRLDEPGRSGKYLWISSRIRKNPNGPSPGSLCHIPRGITGPVETLRITEGELKADITFLLSKVPTISIPGVGQWKEVLPLVNKLKPGRVIVSLDADFRTNAAVADAVRGLVRTLSKSHEVVIETWPLEQGKGIDDVLVAGHTPSMLTPDDVHDLLARSPSGSKTGQLACFQNKDVLASQDERIVVAMATDEHRVNNEVVAALANDVNLFVRAGQLTQIVGEDTIQDGILRAAGTKRIRVIQPASLRELMTRIIRFVQIKVDPEGGDVEKDMHPPYWCVSAVHARGEWPSVRTLRAIVTCPVLRSDGTILATNGYDPTTGLFLSSVIDLPPIPDKPSHDDAVRAVSTLLAVVVDFPFAKPEHRAAWLAFVLTPLARYAFTGPSPLFLIDANTRGSGKSLLADLGGIIATGNTLPRMANPKDDEECRKRITALAIAGDSMVLIDNIVGHLGCASLDAALTAPDSWKDRILGKSEMVELPLSLTWAATGNNVMLEADTSRRTLHIRLESPEENPELRKGFQQPHLVTHVKNKRAELVAAGLTILSAYHAAGCPRMNLPAWGSFDAWSALVREAVVWCGQSDPGQTREELAKRSDLVAGVLQVLIGDWSNIDPDDEGLTSSELLRYLEHRCPEHEAIREAICELCMAPGDRLPSPRSLGNRLRQVRGRVVNGRTLDSIDRHGSASWIVRPVKRLAESCSGGSGCSVPPSGDIHRGPMESSPAADKWEDVQ